MKTFVLVAGAWLGGWAWEDVERELEALGQEAIPLTLSGMDPSGNSPTRDPDINNWVTEVVEAVRAIESDEVVLVGHSFGGALVGAAADRVADRLARIVYVDTGPMPGGAAYTDFFPPELARFVSELVETKGELRRVPFPGWDALETRFEASAEGLSEAVRTRIQRDARPMPFRVWTTHLDRPQDGVTPTVAKTLIASSWPLAQIRAMIEAGHPWFAELEGPEWEFLELPTGHWPMFSRPAELARILADR